MEVGVCLVGTVICMLVVTAIDSATENKFFWWKQVLC